MPTHSASLATTGRDLKRLLAAADERLRDWRKLLRKLVRHCSSGEPVGVDVRKLARLHTLPDAGEPLVVRTYQPDQALVVTCGDWFIAAVMPIRVHPAHASDPARLGHWTALQPASPHATNPRWRAAA